MKKLNSKNASWLTEVAADRDEWVEMLGVAASDASLRKVSISRQTWNEIVAGKSPLVSMASHKLAAFQRYGHLEELLGRTWRDFFVAGDSLALPGIKYPLDAQALRAVWINLQELPILRDKVKRLEADSDFVEISPPVSAWLFRLGKRPLTQS